jgi:hypothetical protein
MSRRGLLLAPALFLTLPVTFAAQTRSSDATSVSREVVAVLMQGPDIAPGEPFDLRVGTAPEAFPADLMPNGTRVAASATTANALAVVGTVARFAQADRPGYEGSLHAAGWIDNEVHPRGLNAAALGAPIAVCRGARFATVTFTPRDAGGVFVRASITEDPKRTCAARPRATYGDVPIPSMRPPSGAESSGAGFGGNPDAMYSSVRLRTGQPLDAIASHYTSQLSAAGWKVDGQTTEPQQVAVTRLSAATTAGEPLSGTLVVTSLGRSNEVDVLLRIVRVSGR